MTEDRPILEYASSAPASATPAGDRTFTFAPPPIAGDLIVQGIVVAVFGGAAIVLLVMGGQSLLQQWSWHTFFLYALCIFVCLMVMSSNWRHLRNGMRFDRLPIKLTIANDHLILANPPRWGLQLLTIKLADIRDCRAEFAGWSPSTIYRIHVELRRRGTLELRVTSPNAAAVDEAVAAITSRLRSAAAAN
jgi:hypothetical protein